MRRRPPIDGRQDLPAEEMGHVESRQGYFLLWARNSPCLDADLDRLCNGRVALVCRDRREGLGDGLRRWSRDCYDCGGHNSALGQEGAPAMHCVSSSGAEMFAVEVHRDRHRLRSPAYCAGEVLISPQQRPHSNSESVRKSPPRSAAKNAAQLSRKRRTCIKRLPPSLDSWGSVSQVA
jgi:hypothetical protein